MDVNIYQAPESEILDDNTKTNVFEDKEFYVVSLKKFLILYIFTMGVYQYYWILKHWSMFKKSEDAEIWPILRTIFSIFFMHSLFERFNERAKQYQPGFSWAASTMATVYVIGSILSSITDKLSERDIGSPYLVLVGLIMLPLTGWILYQAQKAANIACGDAEGRCNQDFTVANYIWSVIGVLMMLVVALVFLEIPLGLSEL